MLITIDRLERAAALALCCEPEEMKKETYEHYGLSVFTCNGLEYAVGTDEEADKATGEYIKQSLWAFNASFIIDHSKVSYSTYLEKSLKQMQGKLCESANDLVLAVIEDIDSFVDDAIAADGRGAFLSPYDGNEQEIKIDGEFFYAYRLN